MEILSKIGFDWQVALANLVNFLIIFFLLKRFIFKPVGKILEERKNKIADGLEKAALAETALLNAKKEHESIVRDAKMLAGTITSNAEKEGSVIKDKRKKEAESERNVLLQETREELLKEKINAETELASKAVMLAMAGATKIITEDMTKEKHELIAKKEIDSLVTAL
ncbi:MAG: F-type H+-transporting ATPase subunit b [Bacteroidota bacterium]|jgi:F-type H+-transporting ATPase subunit b|nr:F0F1 ATP synthase subunit B [Candidatus Paceibacterota bacterium]MDQ5929245.1 F-type H+-transporting ATPase subunit b [Bacteroidota bacterium]